MSADRPAARVCRQIVIPAKAGIQRFAEERTRVLPFKLRPTYTLDVFAIGRDHQCLDSGIRRNDGLWLSTRGTQYGPLNTVRTAGSARAEARGSGGMGKLVCPWFLTDAPGFRLSPE
jgi:hypothetical protein